MWPRMYREVVALEVDPLPYLEGCTTVSAALAATLQCYSERPCIGYPVPYDKQTDPTVPRAAVSVGEPVLPTVEARGAGHDCHHVDITWTCSECAAEEDRGDSISPYRLSATRSLRVAAKASRTSQTLTMPIEETLSTETDRTTEGAGSDGIAYRWLSYAQVFESARDFGIGLRELIKLHNLNRAGDTAAAGGGGTSPAGNVVADDTGAGPAHTPEAADAPTFKRPARAEADREGRGDTDETLQKGQKGFGEVNVSITLKADTVFRNSYTLVVVINEARGLRGMDLNGSSNPFVKVSVGKEKTAKSGVIKKTLNPKWGKEFVFHGITSMDVQETQLEVSVWDFDRLTANEFMGGYSWRLEETLREEVSDQWFRMGGKKQFITAGVKPIDPGGDGRPSRGKAAYKSESDSDSVSSESETNDSAAAEQANRSIGPDIQTKEPIVLLYAEASPEWYIAQYGCHLAECVIVPVLDTTPEEQVVDIFKQCSPSAIITSEKLYEAAKRIATGGSVTSMPIITIAGAGQVPFNADASYRHSGPRNGKNLWDAAFEQITSTTISNVVELGVHTGRLNVARSGPTQKPLPPSVQAAGKCRGTGKVRGSNYQPRMLIPTSGSSGAPKLIVVTDEMMVRQFAVPQFGEISVVYSFQPIRQSFDTLIKGGSIGLWSGNLNNLHSDMAVLRPTHFGSTPVFWKTQLQQFNALIKQAEKIGEERGDGKGVGGRGTERDRQAAITSAVREQLVKRWHEKRLIGNRCHTVLIGGASSTLELKSFVQEVCDTNVIDSYGTSEMGAIASNAEVTGSIELQLVDAPELGYLTTDEPHPRGEVVANTVGLTPGYYNDSKANERAFEMIGGKRHFRTGDIGLLVDGKINVIDRKSAMFKLSNGVFVAPTPLEDIYGRSTLISQCMVYAAFEGRNVGIAVVLTDIGTQACFRPGTDADSEPILTECARLAREHGRKPHEVPERVVLTMDPWTVANGLLVSSFKICRPKLLRALLQFVKIDRQDPAKEDALISTGSTPADGPAIIAAVTTQPASGHGLTLAAGLENVLRAHILALEGGTPMPTAAHTIFDLGVDSLALAALRSALKARFGVSIPMSRLASASIWEVQTAVLGGGVASLPFTEGSPEELIDAVSKAQAEVQETSSQRRRHRRHTHVLNKLEMDPSQWLSIHWYNNSRGTGVVSGQIFSKKNASEGGSVVLLTGATGFVGAFILHEIIRCDPWVRVICLVRAETNKAAALRVSNTLAYYNLQCASFQWSAMAGNLAKEQFGLSKEAYEHLEDTLDEVYHAGAIVNAALPFSAIRGANIDGTRRIVQLCLGADANLHYISAISVLSNTGIKDEVLEVPVPQIKASAYAKSKWVAEQIVIGGANDFNLKARIYRLGNMAAHSITGACNPNDTFTRMLEGIMHMGFYPAVTHAHEAYFPEGFYLTPIDWAVRAIHSVASRPFHRHRHDSRSPVDTMHITSNHLTRFKTAIEAIDEMHETEAPTSLGKWQSVEVDAVEDFEGSQSRPARASSGFSTTGSDATAAPIPAPTRRPSSVGLGRWEPNSNDGRLESSQSESSRLSISRRLSTLLGAEVEFHNQPNAMQHHSPPSAPNEVDCNTNVGRRRSALWNVPVSVSPEEFHERLGTIGVDNPLFPFRDTLRLKRHPLSSRRPTISMKRTLQHIAPCPLVCAEELFKMLKFLGTKSAKLPPCTIGPPLVTLKPLRPPSAVSAARAASDDNSYKSKICVDEEKSSSLYFSQCEEPLGRSRSSLYFPSTASELESGGENRELLNKDSGDGCSDHSTNTSVYATVDDENLYQRTNSYRETVIKESATTTVPLLTFVVEV